MRFESFFLQKMLKLTAAETLSLVKVVCKGNELKLLC